MAELPTKEELEKLYYEKGRSALVWYAWRNALRALPILGCLPLTKIWPQNTVRHIYKTIRICLVLAQWEKIQLLKFEAILGSNIPVVNENSVKLHYPPIR